MLCVTASADQPKRCSVVSCRCDASLPYPPSQRKIPAVPVISLCWHYLLGVSADAWQNDIPDSSAAPVDNSPACLIKKKIPNHIPLMPLAVTPAIFFPAREALVQIPVVVQRTGGKKAEGKCFISLVEWVNAKEASKLKPRRSNMRGAPVELNQQLWNTFMNSHFFSISSRFLSAMTSVLVPQRGKKEMNVSKETAGRSGRRFRDGSEDCSHSCLSGCFPICTQSERRGDLHTIWRNQRGRYAFGLAHQQQQQLSGSGHRPGLVGWLWSITLVVLRGQHTVCTSFLPASVSLRPCGHACTWTRVWDGTSVADWGNAFGVLVSILIQCVSMSNKENTQVWAVASHKRCSVSLFRITFW